MQKACLLLITVFTFSFIQSLDAQDIPPKRELRGAWVATVANIDFPKNNGYSPERLQDEWTGILDQFQEMGLNAVFAQIRPAGDAFYPSKIAPWSRYLTGRQGEPIDKDFDPMAMMIRETHARNMEFHAWLNPYRASMDTIVGNLHKNHPYHSHPDWFVKYGGKLYFNPAKDDVRDYLTEIVLEILMDYDVDGIHFDDYFYPYPAAGEAFPDAEDFAEYGYGYNSIEKWRRKNVDKLIAQVSTMIKTVSPHVKFGISPFGVWRNASSDPQLGSATRAGIESYDDLYADVRLWLEKGWIDYVAPQLYWNIGFAPADYEILLDWWQKNSFGKHVYAGYAMYKVNGESAPAWKDPNEIPRQILLSRAYPNVQGGIFFNTTSLLENRLGVTNSIAEKLYTLPAVLPELPHLKIPTPAAPNLEKPKKKKGKLKLNLSIKPGEENAHYFILYRFEDRRPGDYNNPQNILEIIPINGRRNFTYVDETAQTGKIYTYAVSAVNRQHTESLLSEWRAVEVKEKRVKRVK